MTILGQYRENQNYCKIREIMRTNVVKYFVFCYIRKLIVTKLCDISSHNDKTKFPFKIFSKPIFFFQNLVKSHSVYSNLCQTKNGRSKKFLQKLGLATTLVYSSTVTVPVRKIENHQLILWGGFEIQIIWLWREKFKFKGWWFIITGSRYFRSESIIRKWVMGLRTFEETHSCTNADSPQRKFEIQKILTFRTRENFSKILVKFMVYFQSEKRNGKVNSKCLIYIGIRLYRMKYQLI